MIELIIDRIIDLLCGLSVFELLSVSSCSVVYPLVDLFLGEQAHDPIGELSE